MRCDCTILVCICVEFTEICCCVTVSGCVSMLVVFESRCVWVDCQFV